MCFNEAQRLLVYLKNTTVTGKLCFKGNGKSIVNRRQQITYAEKKIVLHRKKGIMYYIMIFFQQSTSYWAETPSAKKGTQHVSVWVLLYIMNASLYVLLLTSSCYTQQFILACYYFSLTSGYPFRVKPVISMLLYKKLWMSFMDVR